MKKKTKVMLVLLLPLVLSAIWLVFLLINIQNPVSGMSYSPSFARSIINMLTVFMVIYGAILAIFFMKMR
ncbi:MAG: hypothetical protein KAK00_10280 [Nanoarchaeota archaeon]|nr:hypothetical protein [Nanoarchaeota archaeon]